MRNAHPRNWNMGRNMKNEENETQTLFDLDYGGKTENSEKLDTNTIGPGIW